MVFKFMPVSTDIADVRKFLTVLRLKFVWLYVLEVCFKTYWKFTDNGKKVNE